MKNINICLFIILTGAAVSGCVTPEPETQAVSGNITLMTWNIHNLFDGTDNGNEYSEFLLSSGWSAEKYMGRINTISAAIGKIEPKPDVFMFQEIESLRILEDLSSALGGGYSWSHFAGNADSAIGIGIISRFPLVEIKSHSINIDGEITPRPVLEARVQTEADDIIIFACHWKSKIGGDDVTENVRKASARVILRRIRELWESDPEICVIVAGDLNENYDEFYRQGSVYISALLPDDPYCAQLTGAEQKDYIVISGNMPPSPVYFQQTAVTLFSPWIREMQNGSYYYKYNWETIDHFLLSYQFFNDTGWEFERAFVVNTEPFADSAGIPVPYNPRTGYGLSDHLPLLLALRNSK
ncbi:MAG: endonuclease/exonuclease/phosphatase family protein [Treponema sp.]|nr:endonuclease/exonuclease/phosphatase family protein [Treponema sp.]